MIVCKGGDTELAPVWKMGASEREKRGPFGAVRRILMSIKPHGSLESQAKESLSYGNKATADNPVDRR
jgi:hypothetical protein